MEKLSVLILAGGLSTRMGQDKAWLALDGQPLVERVARWVLPMAAELMFSTNTPEPYRQLAGRLPVPVQIVADRHPGAGPLAGLEAGLSVARHELVLMVAADMPFLNLSLLTYMADLADAYDVVIPAVPASVDAGARPQWNREPLHAFYRRTCLGPIEAHLRLGHRRVISFLDDVRVRDVMPGEITPFDPKFLSFFNVNTLQEWEQAKTIQA
jgi:molybdopterin-guanine dinucleotide biosynthesis protein A